MTALSNLSTRTIGQKAIAVTFALTIGVLFVFGAGFAPAHNLHEAAHDVRHSAAFPCH